MADIHIDDFYKDAGNILLSLYQSFPRSITLYVEDICGPDQPDEYGVHSTRHSACFSTMIWLADEAYLRYGDTIRQDAVDQACLSQRAFLVLSGRLDAPDGRQNRYLDEQQASVVAALRQALKSRDSAQIRPIMQAIMAAVNASL